MPIEDFQFPQSLNYFSYQFHYTVTRRHVPIKVIDKSNICKLRNKGAERHGGREVSSATTVLYTLQLYFIMGLYSLGVQKTPKFCPKYIRLCHSPF